MVVLMFALREQPSHWQPVSPRLFLLPTCCAEWTLQLGATLEDLHQGRNAIRGATGTKRV